MCQRKVGPTLIVVYCRIPFQHNVGLSECSCYAKNQLDQLSRFDRTPTCDRQTQGQGTQLIPQQHSVAPVKTNKYVRPRNSQTKMYAGRVACCPLVRHVEYAPCALLTLAKDPLRLLIKVGEKMRQADGRQTNTLELGAAGVKKQTKWTGQLKNMAKTVKLE